jgi:hypothetical protein
MIDMVDVIVVVNDFAIVNALDASHHPHAAKRQNRHEN